MSTVKLKRIIFIRFRLLAKILLFVLPIAFLARVYWPETPAEITYAALRWPGEITVTNEQDKKDILEALKYVQKMRQPGPPKQLALYSLTVKKGKKEVQYLLSEDGDYFLPDGTAVLPSYRLREMSNGYIARLERLSPYGQLMPWEEARHIFRRYTKATVEDVDTGLRFEVQRRAGTYHADVQPLTARDTEIMKEIYNGEWSWRRRAIVVEVADMRLAASMNGMPHGEGRIRYNNFDGHFCIHFLGSTTHAHPDEPNLAHQIMVWKAACRLPEMLKAANPEEVAEIALCALDQQAPDIALHTLAGEPELDAKDFLRQARTVKGLDYQIGEMDKNTRTVNVKVQIDYVNGPQDVKKELQLQMIYSLGYWWKIDPRSIMQIFEQKTTANFADLPPRTDECT